MSAKPPLDQSKMISVPDLSIRPDAYTFASPIHSARSNMEDSIREAMRKMAEIVDGEMMRGFAKYVDASKIAPPGPGEFVYLDESQTVMVAEVNAVICRRGDEDKTRNLPGFDHARLYAAWQVAVRGVKTRRVTLLVSRREGGPLIVADPQVADLIRGSLREKK